MIALIAWPALLCVALFAIGFIAPRLSERVQGRLDHGAERATSAAQAKPEPVRAAGESTLDTSRRAADRTSEAGRRERGRAARARQ